MGYMVNPMNGRRIVLRFAVVAIAVTWTIAVIAAQCWTPQLHRLAVHPNHPLVTAVGAEFAVNMDHAHFSDDSTPPCPQEIATAALPRTDTPVFAAEVVAAATVTPGAYDDLVVPAGRGPPRSPGLPQSGQDVLNRFCLSRR